MDTDLTKSESHFAFGENWSAYSRLIDKERIAAAELHLARLLGVHDLSGKRVLDIGSGSGLHCLAALRLGAGSVLAIDIDAQSVATTRETLSRFAPSLSWAVCEASVFDLKSSELGEFDIVYSWGVLHHTGDLHRAIASAAGLVAPGGWLALALYRRIWMDWLWKLEKRWYAQASPLAQAWVRKIYSTAFNTKLRATGRSPTKYRNEYFHKRGMSFEHDMHDWLGGWPYESISSTELHAQLTREGFRLMAGHDTAAVRSRTVGLFGTGCGEYLYERVRNLNLNRA